MLCILTGMYRGLRDLLGGGARESRVGTVLAVQRGAHRVRGRLQHGQDHDRRQRGHLRHHRRGGARVRGRVAPPLPHRAPTAHPAAREDAQPMLRRTHRHAEPQRPSVLVSYARRVWKAA